MNLYFYPPNKLNPFTGYGRNEYGLFRGLVEAGATLTPLASIALVMGNPLNVQHLSVRGKKTVLYTMSESDKVSDLWVDRINRMVDLVLVPCPDLVGIYAQSGITVPIVCVGHGVDLSVPPVGQPPPTGPGEPFNFLTYSLGDLRKGAELAVMALFTEFPDEPHVNILVKVSKTGTWVEGAQGPRVKVITEDLPEDYWITQLSNHHCFVFPSRGEGWGMPPREATLAGIPAIGTQWLGMSDIDKWGVPLKVLELRDANFSDWEANAHDARWSEPDIDDLRARMRAVYTDYQYYRNVALEGREYLLSTFTYKQVAQRILEAIQNVFTTG